MKRQIAYIFLAALAIVACGKNDEKKINGGGNGGGGGNANGYVREIEQAEDDFQYREASVQNPVLYTPSLNFNKYLPIEINYYTGSAPTTYPATPWTPNWRADYARIVHYMSGYQTPFKTYEKYSKWVNKWGSTKTKAKREATGRFRVEKIDGRWWIIDPMGYLHYERGFDSFRQGSSSRNKAAWNAKYGSDEKWVLDSRTEFVQYGFHGTGAFGSGGSYAKVITHNQTYPLAPLTLAPSFSFLSAFKSAKSISWSTADNFPIALVLMDGWEQWCKDYLAGSAFEPYRNNIHVLGFFSDNEINFSSSSEKLLREFLKISDDTDRAKQFAASFMRKKGLPATTSSYTDELNSEFCGLLAENYYHAVHAARDAADPQLMYLGTRLHGTPKYLQGVVEAAGRHCDIVSINYYGRWAAELDTKVKDWGTWANKPFLVTEFYVKALDNDLNNQSGAGWIVPTQEDRAYWYQHFTLSLLEAKNCVGWHWFKYQDDDGTDNNGQPANKGMYDNSYNIYPILGKFAREVNFNAYDLIDYFDGKL